MDFNQTARDTLTQVQSELAQGKRVFAPEADIFCFTFLPVQKPFRFKCDFIYGQIISSGEHWAAVETAALEAAVNRIAEKMFQTAR